MTTPLPQRPPFISLASQGVPAIAASAGYNLRTFGPNVTLGVNMYPFNFLGQTAGPGAGALVQNGDGSLTCTGNTNIAYNADCCSARQNNAKLNHWEGQAFGGGAYFEGVLKFPAFTGSVSGQGWPAFWTDPIEGIAGVSSFAQWPGQVAGYLHSCELDFMEFDAGVINEYGCACHDEYGVSGSIVVFTPSFASGGSPVTVSADLSQYNTYACLWVPATSSAQGTISFYFNGVQVASYSYNQYNPALPPPPLAGSSAMSILDVRHPALILGCSNPLLPMTVRSMSVWQANTSQNLIQ